MKLSIQKQQRLYNFCVCCFHNFSSFKHGAGNFFILHKYLRLEIFTWNSFRMFWLAGTNFLLNKHQWLNKHKSSYFNSQERLFQFDANAVESNDKLKLQADLCVLFVSSHTRTTIPKQRESELDENKVINLFYRSLIKTFFISQFLAHRACAARKRKQLNKRL